MLLCEGRSGLVVIVQVQGSCEFDSPPCYSFLYLGSFKGKTQSYTSKIGMLHKLSKVIPREYTLHKAHKAFLKTSAL